ncbi:Uncharacterised protein [Bordetella pertussis]|nr:Uncharacterised protein [Bordetella pertussis]
MRATCMRQRTVVEAGSRSNSSATSAMVYG